VCVEQAFSILLLLVVDEGFHPYVGQGHLSEHWRGLDYIISFLVNGFFTFKVKLPQLFIREEVGGK
jgi:hypothetical protein